MIYTNEQMATAEQDAINQLAQYLVGRVAKRNIGYEWEMASELVANAADLPVPGEGFMVEIPARETHDGHANPVTFDIKVVTTS